MSVTVSDKNPGEQTAPASAPVVPKRITNAQTVCNEKNAKGKLCNGHLKQLRTAGEAAEIHLRGDDVLFKCQTCGTFYMGPPLGHVRDPNKQSRFVEAELTALLQAAGGTMPVIKKDERGVYVMVESAPEHGHAPAKPAPAKSPAAPAQQPATAAPVARTAATPKVEGAAKPAVERAGAQPNRELMRRTTYAGVDDTGPVPGETFEQKVARLKAVSVAAKQRAEESGGEVAPSPVASAETSAAETAATQVAPTIDPAVGLDVPPPVPVAQARVAGSSEASAHKPTGQADRTLMIRSTYCGVVDTGPVAGETFAQKCERLRAVSAAAKQRADEGGG
jgi:hypothetical protein